MQSVTDLCGSLGKGQLKAPTLRSVRRMTNLVAARNEINRRSGPAGGFPFEAYANPLEYSRWDPNIFLAYDIHPMRYLQQDFVHEYCYEPDSTVPMTVKGRIVQSGTIPNRIIERSLVRKLNSNIDAYFSDQSWAYRPRRSTQMAILQVREAVRRGRHWALKTDIEHFFASIGREILEKQLRDTLEDSGLCEMILRANSPVNDRRAWIELSDRTEGLPQGNGLSPFLSNLYLNGFDENCSNLDYRRYADDILVLGSSKSEVVKARQHIKRLLAQLGLRLNLRKTFIQDLHQKPLTFLGYEIRGGNIYPPMKAILKLETKLRVRGQEVRKINLMRQFVARYSMCGVRKLFRRIDREIYQHYPAGATLTAMLDHPARVQGSVGNSEEQVAGPKGKAARMAAKKAHLGQAPVADAAWGQNPIPDVCSLAPTELGRQ
jgi:RNA-directed DNA polymerase